MNIIKNKEFEIIQMPDNNYILCNVSTGDTWNLNEAAGEIWNALDLCTDATQLIKEIQMKHPIENPEKILLHTKNILEQFLKENAILEST